MIWERRMDMPVAVIQEILLPFLGTFFGAGCVFFMRDGLHPIIQRTLTGFAAGVMEIGRASCRERV